VLVVLPPSAIRCRSGPLPPSRADVGHHAAHSVRRRRQRRHSKLDLPELPERVAVLHGLRARAWPGRALQRSVRA
jgi:hypothetical protein